MDGGPAEEIESSSDEEEETEETEEERPREKGPDAKWRMELTEEEREWALAIKAAAVKVPELDTFSDFFYVQMAIYSMFDPDETNIELVLERMLHYQQYFRETKKIQDTYETACRTLDKIMLELVPGHYLSYNWDTKEEAYALVMDPTNFDRETINDLSKFDVQIAATFFLLNSQHHDFEAMRRGVVTMWEGGGYDWRGQDMFNIRCTKRHAEIVYAYPVHPRSLRFYNMGMFGNLWMAFCKRLMPKEVCKAYESGWECGGKKLSEILLVPDLETATRRTLANAKEALRKRYANEEKFSLGNEANTI